MLKETLLIFFSAFIWLDDQDQGLAAAVKFEKPISPSFILTLPGFHPNCPTL